MKASRYALLIFLTHCYNGRKEFVCGREINPFTKSNGFTEETEHHSHIYPNLFPDVPLRHNFLYTTESFDRFIGHDWQTYNDPKASKYLPDDSDSNINNEEKNIEHPIHHDNPKQYIGLSLLKTTGHRRILSSNNKQESRDSFYLDDVLPIEYLRTINRFTKEEKDCFDNKHVYYNRSCQQLFERGPCRENEWLILDLESLFRPEPALVPKCVPRYCERHEVYWSETHECYKLSIETDGKLCQPGTSIDYDYFTGYGICKCIRRPHVHGLFNNGTCFPLYTRGPCLKHYIFVENYHTTKCIRNPCRNSSLVYWEDGDKNCYELNSIGPCDKSQRFMVSTVTLKPTCLEDSAGLSIINPPTLCATTSDKICQPEFKVNQGAEYIKRILIAAYKKKLKQNKN